MHLYILACDLDGTLATEGKVASETWDLLRQAVNSGLVFILVTGRSLDDLTQEGAYADLCEAIVAENGAVVYFPKSDRLELPFGILNRTLLDRLETVIPLERGLAIGATRVPHDEESLKILREMGGGATVEYNRDAVMLLPPGATKGTGLAYALHQLGYSERNVVACGDAENDHSLFEWAELTVAVANATANIQALADVVLSKPDGEGVRGLIQDLMAGRVPAHTPRTSRQLLLGHNFDGSPVTLDAFPLMDNGLGIFGASGSGKSWLAGLLAEEIFKHGYQACLIDPEGDYRGLRSFPHSLVLGGPKTELPPVADVITLCEYSDINLVVDLSAYDPAKRTAYVQNLLRAFQSLRARRGRPHWFLLDEIQSFCPPGAEEMRNILLGMIQHGGMGIVSYRPSQVDPALLEALDYWLLLRLHDSHEAATLKRSFATKGVVPKALEQLSTLDQGQACLFSPSQASPQAFDMEPIVFHVGIRAVPHIRHLHKYLRAPLPEDKRFYFDDSSGRFIHRSSASLWEFMEDLNDIPIDSLDYHLERGDFEHWVSDVIHDQELSRRLSKIRHRNLADEELRQALLETICARFEELDNLA